MENQYWKVDPDLKYLQVYPMKEKTLGLPKGGLVGKSFLDFMDPADANKVREVFYTNDNVPRSFSHVVVRYISRRGFLLVIEISGVPIFDNNSVFLGFQGTEQDLAAIPVQVEGKDGPQLELIFGMAPIAICAVARNGRLLAVNAKYADLFCRPLMSLMGGKVGDIDTASGLKATNDFKCLDSGGSVPDHEVSINGREYLVSVTPISSASISVVAICVVLLDITERKRLERAVAAANQRLEEMNTKDYLTGAYNRRYFDEFLTREILNLGRTGGSLSVAFIDVDFFKRYNDAYGHYAGDHCLIRLVSVMKENLLRSTDSLFRYGGEEFIVVMPSTDDVGAMALAERLRESVYNLNIPHSENSWGRVTISVGLKTIEAACAHCALSSSDEVIKAADKALYKAKANGRNSIWASNHICSPKGSWPSDDVS
ncbi:MAG: diguanylate cyclase [Desulfovibrio sp.]|nr:diguanylate cyclase [Desulfovibrio sp.]